MMDYSKLSDFEINKRVLAIKSGMKPLGYAHNADDRSAGIVDVSNSYHWFDFCNNAADAWPIIVANRIALMPDASEHGAHQWWDAQSSCQTHGIQYQANPLRAAMIVFLMMQGDE